MDRTPNKRPITAVRSPLILWPASASFCENTSSCTVDHQSVTLSLMFRAWATVLAPSASSRSAHGEVRPLPGSGEQCNSAGLTPIIRGQTRSVLSEVEADRCSG
jgi:hypothetical protein